MTDEQRKAQIRALIEERETLVKRGLDDRVAQVDVQLRLLGHDAKAPRERAEKRPVAVADRRE